jgi:steroid delta-isomerase-like uncharacterized protein
MHGPEGLRRFLSMIFKSFPDLHETIEDIIAEEDKVWHRFTATGIHEGEFRGLAPTGKKVALTGVNFWRMVEGKVVEKGSIYDMLDTLKQLCAIKYTDKAKGVLPEDV